jgi:hypothetical protein
MKSLRDELEAAGYCTSDVEQVIAAQEKGLVDDKTAAEALGYDPNKVEEAHKDQKRQKELGQKAPPTPGGPLGIGPKGGAPKGDQRSEELTENHAKGNEKTELQKKKTEEKK